LPKLDEEGFSPDSRQEEEGIQRKNDSKPKPDLDCRNGQETEGLCESSEEGADKLESCANNIEEMLDEKNKLIEEYQERLIRAKADYDNYRKRTQKEIREIHMYAAEEIIKDILPVMDNFERALDSVQDKTSSVYQGIEMIYEQLKSVLKQHGVEEIQAYRMVFDPKYHEAVMTVDSDEHEDETIVEVFQKGYTYHSRVIRPSMVKVAKKI
jgi:molecular chaperone GrpE